MGDTRSLDYSSYRDIYGLGFRALRVQVPNNSVLRIWGLVIVGQVLGSI